MDNYININNQKISLTEEQAERIVAALSTDRVKLSDIAEGDTFKIGSHEFVLLELFDDTAAILIFAIRIPVSVHSGRSYLRP